MPPKGWRKYPDEARRQAAKAAEIDANGVSLEDITLPRSTVLRLAKQSLPANGQIQKEALIAITKSATVFVSYLGSHATDIVKHSNRRYITPKDVLEALEVIELESLADPLRDMIEKYNQANASKLAAKKDAAAAASADTPDLKNDDVTEEEGDIEEEDEDDNDEQDEDDEQDDDADTMTDNNLMEGTPRKKIAPTDDADHLILPTSNEYHNQSPETRQVDEFNRVHDVDDNDEEVTDSE